MYVLDTGRGLTCECGLMDAVSAFRRGVGRGLAVILHIYCAAYEPHLALAILPFRRTIEVSTEASEASRQPITVTNTHTTPTIRHTQTRPQATGLAS